MTVLADLRQLAQALSAAGVKTAIDPGRVTVPGAWITARSITGGRVTGDRTYSFDLYLISPRVDTVRALGILDTLLEQATGAIGGIITDSDLGTQISLPDQPGLPAFHLTLEPH
ncbi:hypothetical protein ACL1A3_10265 [Corynebacterium striatum]